MIKNVIVFLGLLLCLCVSSWARCQSGETSYYAINNSRVCSEDDCNGGQCPSTYSYAGYIWSNPTSNHLCGYGGFTWDCPGHEYWSHTLECTYTILCDTQAEADSAACELNPGMHWADGICSAPVCESSCSSQKTACTDWKDSVTYTVDTETGDTTFTCVGYCKTARMTHTDSVEALDDSLSIIYRKNFADSVKVSYGENCTSPADTTGGGNPQEVAMTYYVTFNGVENSLDTAGVSFVKGLYNQSCESTLYRGIKNGRYVFWYSPNDIPEGVTNVVRIR